MFHEAHGTQAERSGAGHVGAQLDPVQATLAMDKQNQTRASEASSRRSTDHITRDRTPKWQNNLRPSCGLRSLGQSACHTSACDVSAPWKWLRCFFVSTFSATFSETHGRGCAGVRRGGRDTKIPPGLLFKKIGKGSTETKMVPSDVAKHLGSQRTRRVLERGAVKKNSGHHNVCCKSTRTIARSQ